jgi:hypothetical protein
MPGDALATTPGRLVMPENAPADFPKSARIVVRVTRRGLRAQKTGNPRSLWVRANVVADGFNRFGQESEFGFNSLARGRLRSAISSSQQINPLSPGSRAIARCGGELR